MTDIKPKSVNFSSQINSRDYYKGTSFRWAGSWEPGKLYSNDTYFIDFVSYDGSMWVCIKSHYASDSVAPSKTSEYWQSVVDNSDMKGPQGEKGEKGDKGEKGETGSEGKSAYEVWKDFGGEGSEEDFFNSLKGERGEQGFPGVHVGPEPPTEEEYGPNFQNILWLQTNTTSSNVYKVYSSEEVDAKFAEKSALDNYYTKEEIDNIVSNSGADVDLSNYYTKSEIDDKNFLQTIPEEYLKQEDLEQTLSKSYYTIEEIDGKFENIPTCDLSNYVTKEEIDAYVDENELKIFVTENVSEIIKQEINNIAPSDIDGGSEGSWEYNGNSI